MKFDIITAPKRTSRHWQPGTITWDQILAWCKTPARMKESGGYVLGRLRETTVVHKDAYGQPEPPCHGYHRKKTAVIDRCALTLDVDFPKPGFAEKVELVLPHKALLHTTYSSTAEEPRYRLIIPLDRKVAPDEYHIASAAIMQRLGENNFDPGSTQHERFMFKPAAKALADFSFVEIDGPVAEADSLLVDFQPDLSALPMPKPSRAKRDPFSIEGTIGAFNRSYQDFGYLIEQYELPYQEAGVDRWQLVGAAGAAGMGPIAGAEGLVYSHHSADPAFDVTCSAFDLARLHLYGDLDEDLPSNTPVNKLPSQQAMLERATEDVNVVKELVGGDFSAEMAVLAEDIEEEQGLTPRDWRLDFRLEPRTGQPKDDIVNWDLIAAHDRAFKVLYYNELSMAIEISEDLPWRKLTKGRETFTAGDRSSLALYIERTYKIRPARGYLDDLINDRALNRRRNPVKEYLEALRWDGKPRVETCLPGVTPTDFTRLVARKVMTAAVARMLDPGCKWDHMLVIYGPEGMGKSHWIDKMTLGFSSSLGRLNDKDTLITMQRSWIMTSDEGHTLKKADFDAQKEFITRTHDTFRMPYERESQVHPRHCVIWGTTNDDVFLRRQEGNRRFLIVRSDQKVDFDQLTDHYIGQVWAEAVHYYNAGEQLWLDTDDNEMAKAEREQFTEEDALTGIVEQYLGTLVPETWDEMSPESRQLWLQNASDDLVAVGTEPITRICSLQIWVEAMGRRRGDHRRVDLLEISTVLKAMPGWRLEPGTHRIPGYGPQKVFVKLDGADLL